jgi:F-type H+-transporting ATPase subunit alpha
LLDDVPVDQMRPFEEFLYPFLERKHAQLLPEVANKKELTDELREALTKAITAAKAEFTAARGIKAA